MSANTRPSARGTSATSSAADVESLRYALRGWLGSGPIDSPEGAYFAWVEEGTGRAAFEYPEITGYALTYLMGRSDPSREELARASRAADWLADRLDQGDRSARDGWDDGAQYSFDHGMIASGLLLFGERCDSHRHLHTGLELAAEFRDEIEATGSLAAIPARSPRTAREGWSTEGRAHMLKVVQCLLLAAEHDLAGAGPAAASLVEELSACQRPDGSFRTQPDDSMTMMHPHAYALEGLWMYTRATGDTVALERVEAGLQWAWSRQLESGGFPRFAATDGSTAVEQGDVTSQTIRIAAALGVRPDGFDRALRRLGDYARPAPGGAALVYQPEAGARHHNAWVTMFGAQALDWSAEGAPNWRTLV
jgi:hypothetical protein